MTEFIISEPGEKQVRDALEAVVASDTFADANRLKAFLTYVVNEALNGRGANIRAKLIASDVYGRRPQDGGDQESVVRVDAGRLRRRLDVYYSDEGRTDQVRIHVLAGGYMPTFEAVKPADPEETRQAVRFGSTHRASFLAALLVIGVLGFGTGWFGRGVSDDLPSKSGSATASVADDTERVVRSYVNQVSSASLLARTFVEDARELIFPSIDPARLAAAEILCQRAIELAPELSTGHSCNAFMQAYAAFITPDGDARTARLVFARQEAATSLRIDPADAYAQMADAWTRFVEGDRQTAIERARVAVGIASEQDFLRNFYGMMMAFDGQGPELVSSSFPGQSASDISDRYHPFIMAGAYFQMSEYGEAIREIDAAVKMEGRTSALITTIQIAAYEASGDEKAAETYATNLIASWPGVNYQRVLAAFFSDPSDALAISENVDNAVARLGDHQSRAESR